MTTTLNRGRLAARIDLAALTAWALAFAVIVYLALANGGYDVVPRSQLGIVVWWIVLLGAIAGSGPGRIAAAGWVAIVLLAGFATWTGVSIGWSESAERATIELSRVTTYLGVLVLALWVTARTAARHTLNGVACAVALVTVLAVLSRLQPSWFPPNDHIEFLPAAAGELSYPLNYWNLLAGFTVLGMPLLLAIAVGGRTPAGRAAAAAILPVSVLCLYLTSSRGGVAALAAAVGVMLALAPRRGAQLTSLVVAALGGGILVGAAHRLEALRSGVATTEALSQGDELSYLVVSVMLGAALTQIALMRAGRGVRLPRRPAPSRRNLVIGALILVLLAVVVAGTGQLSERARELARLPAPSSEGAERGTELESAPSDIRYEFWEAGLDAFRTHPLEGIGSGSFEFWWARGGSHEGVFRDAHSLYLESLAELGMVGFTLIAGLVLWVLGQATGRTLRATAGTRIWMAAATGGLVAFSLTAALEWAWEMAVLPVSAMLLGAVVLAGRSDGAGTAAASVRVRLGVASLAVGALVAIALPLASTAALQDSQAAARAGRLEEAIQDARAAERLQPCAMTPKLQRALVLEQLGRLDPAAVAARAASLDEPTNWRPWLVLGRIDAARGRAHEAVLEVQRARELNPRSRLFPSP